MTTSLTSFPPQQIAALEAAYDAAVSRKRLRFFAGLGVFVALLILAGLGAEVAPKTFVEKIGNFAGYFDRILNLDTGQRVWTDPAEWFWGWQKWLKLLAETLLLSYVGTTIGAIGAFALNFFAAANLSPHPAVRFVVRRLLEFCRTVPSIVFALIFVIAFGLGPMAGVLAIAIHSIGALGKLYSEQAENIDMKPLEGVRAVGGNWFHVVRFGAMPQILPNFFSYALLRLEVNIAAAAAVGYVGAGGIGQELVIAIENLRFDDALAIIVMVIALIFVIELTSERIRHAFIGRVR